MMSLKVFTATLEYAFNKVDYENMGIGIDGKRLNNLRFADDFILIPYNFKDAAVMTDELKQATKKNHLYIKKHITKLKRENIINIHK